MLYLHRNNIEDVVEVYKLRKLPKLKTLTLSNNPLCDVEHYRSTIIHLLPDIRKLDNVVVVRSERDSKKTPLSRVIRVRLSHAYPEEFGGVVPETGRPDWLGVPSWLDDPSRISCFSHQFTKQTSYLPFTRWDRLCHKEKLFVLFGNSWLLHWFLCKRY